MQNKINKLPSILIEKITENDDGSANVIFNYEEDFETFVKKSLKLKKKPTKKQVGKFILDCLENSLKAKE